MKKIKEYEEKYQNYFHVGDLQSCINLMREALTEYPKNFQFMINLAHALSNISSIDGAKEEVIKEIITLSERVLEDCAEDNLRHSAIQLLCFNYPRIGQREKAVELAKKMPDMCLCSSMLLANVYEYKSEEHIKTVQKNIQNHIDWVCMDLETLTTQKEMTLHDKILCIETSVKLYEAIYYDGNLLFYHCRLAWSYYNLAECYAQKNKETTLRHLLTAEKHAKTYDEILEEDLPYTSIFLNKCCHSPSHTSKNWIGTECSQLLERLDHKYFEPLLDNLEFIALKERLSAKQK